jgi:hypothetical protein
MSNCSYNTSFRDGKEYGDMDFKIKNKAGNNFYNGMITLGEKENDIKIAFNIKLPLIEFNNELNDNLETLDKLEATNVLQNTLISLLNYIILKTEENTSFIDDLFKDNSIDFFGNLFKKAINNNDIYKKVFENILFKVVGDLFQEINAVCKYGGYTMNNYGTSDEVLPYNKQEESGNQLRAFYANDRPSGCRFIFFLNNGNTNEINEKAFGGVYLGNSNLMVKRKNINMCESEQINGNKTKKRKRGGMKLKYKTKQLKENKKNKKSKKNKKKKKFIRSFKSKR